MENFPWAYLGKVEALRARPGGNFGSFGGSGAGLHSL